MEKFLPSLSDFKESLYDGCMTKSVINRSPDALLASIDELSEEYNFRYLRTHILKNTNIQTVHKNECSPA
jgi:hypothetical protein